MKGKNILTFLVVLDGIGFSSPGLREGLFCGFPLIGQLPATCLFPPNPVVFEPTMSRDDALKASVWKVPSL
eukprot:2568675-Amphidinium_carterae.1